MYTLLTMQDPRWMELADLFCQSIELKKGDNVLLLAIDLEALPFISALYKRSLQKRAASVNYVISIPELDYFFLKNASQEQLQSFPEWDLERMKKMDVFMGALGRTNGCSLKDVSVENQTLRNKTVRPIIDERVKNTRWCITYVPTDHDTMLAGMSTPEYFGYYFSACLQDYAAMKVNNQRLKELMEKTDEVKIVAEGTDLEFSIKGIGAKSCHGECNIPDGEVFTAPIKESVNGYFSCNVPSLYQGREWSNVHIEISGGKIYKATCDQGSDVINKLLDTDIGARFIGEFAIGTNKGIREPAKNILFDEKIFGSFHLTPGSCYDEADNGNKSAIHWDLVKIITPQFGGGFIAFDGTIIMKDGLFVHPELLILNP